MNELIPILQQDRTQEVNNKRTQRKQPISPPHTQTLHPSTRGKIIGQPAKPSSRTRNSNGQAPLLREPLSEYWCGSDVEESEAPAKADALAQEQVPDLCGVGGGEHGKRDEHCADEETDACTELVVGEAYGGRDEEGLGDGHAADEGVFELGCAGEGAIGEEVG